MTTSDALVDAAASGDRLRTLASLRDVLAEAIQTCESKRDLAPLVGRMQVVMDQIAELSPPQAKGDSVDEIARRRAARRAGASQGPASARSNFSG